MRGRFLLLATGGENQPGRRRDHVRMITETSWTMFASFVGVYDGARVFERLSTFDNRRIYRSICPRIRLMTAREAVRSQRSTACACLPVPRVEIFRHNDWKIPINVCERLILQWLRVYLPSAKSNGSMWYRITIRMRNRVMISFKKSDWSVLRFARICANLRGMWLRRRHRERERTKFFCVRCLCVRCLCRGTQITLK